MSLPMPAFPDDIPVRGTLTPNRPLADLTWLRVGGPADWLVPPARGEGLGMGWVSLFEPQALADLLGMPPGSKPLAVLCLGPVAAFYEVPMLVQQGGAEPRPLQALLYENHWGETQR